MANKISLILVFLLSMGFAHGQGGYLPGFIVTLQNDTLYGTVKDRKENVSPRLYKKIKFNHKKGPGKKYSPSQINAYRRGTDDFESLWFEQSTYLWRENFYSRPGTGERTFLKVLYRDYLSLYYWEFTDAESGVFEYVPLFKRTHEEYFVRVTQGILGLKKKRLSEYFSDCPELSEKIQAGEIKSPVEIAIFYNRWRKARVGL